MDQQDFLVSCPFSLGYDSYGYSENEVLNGFMKGSSIMFLLSDNSRRALILQLNDLNQMIYVASSPTNWAGDLLPWEPGVNF